jgi:hypothetical protein
MAELRRFGLADFVLLLLIIALAGGARAGYLWKCCDSGRTPGPLRVQDERTARGNGPAKPETRPLAGYGPLTELDELVEGVQNRFSFSSRTPLSPNEQEATAHASPGYPWVLGLLARYAAPVRTQPGEKEKLERNPNFDLWVRWGQCGLGTLTAALYFLFARRAFGSLFVATLTGIFCALHPFWVIDTATIDDGVLATFVLAAALFFGVRGVQASGAFSSLLHGLLLAALAMVRAALLPFAVVAFLWFLLRCRSVQHGWLCALLAFLGFAIGLAPWSVRNWQERRDVIPITDSAWIHTWEGNHRNATGGPPSAADWSDFDQVTLGVRVARDYRDRRIVETIQEELKRDQVDAVNRRLAAGLYFLFGKSWFDDKQFAAVIPGADPMPEWLARSYPGALSGTVLAMLVLALLGWRWSYGWRSFATMASLAFLWIPLPYILTRADALSGPRLPLDGVLLSFAAFAVGCFVPRLSATLLAGYRPAVREAGRRFSPS